MDGYGDQTAAGIRDVRIGSISPYNADLVSLQPYVDLVQGDAPGQSSLLLDYTRRQYVSGTSC